MANGVLLGSTSSTSSNSYLVTRAPRIRRLSRLCAGKDDSDESGETEDGGDVESARQQLELLMGRDDDTTDSDVSASPVSFSLEDFLSFCKGKLPPPDKVDVYNKHNLSNKDDDDTISTLMESLLPPPPPMSTMERARRLHEIQLLEQLEESDGFSEALWELWYSERGLHKQKILGMTDSLLSNPDTWQQCEQELRKLLEDAPSVTEDDDHRPGVYFVEAVNRLATLYFLQSRLEESYVMCRLVLHLKPWHFGALSGIVQVCIQMNNREEARYWAQQRLPTLAAGTSFPPFTENSNPGAAKNPRRIEWCKQAIRDARALIQRAETNTAKSLGKPEEYYFKKKKKTEAVIEEPLEDQDDAWQ
ncbi:MAG: hypothetical protein SGILL_006231 [Bacillariaceae sp.]